MTPVRLRSLAALIIPALSAAPAISQSIDTSPTWYGSSESASLSVASGDFNADGHLDLVFGNSNARSEVFINRGDGFAADASWTTPVWNTSSVATGDVNGDGCADIVFGNVDEANHLFVSDCRGGFVPYWTSEPDTSLSTRGVALADIDGDGDLDLVSLHSGHGIAINANQDGTLAAAPQWLAAALDFTCLTIADLNGDGLPDLLCGTRTEGIVHYRNTGAGYDSVPTWQSPDTQSVKNLASADTDGDGDLDVVAGYQVNDWGDAGIRLYENVAGLPAPAAAWSGQWGSHVAVALGDVDHDGDPDILTGNRSYAFFHLPGSYNAIYLNDGGVFSSATWLSRSAEPTECAALADIDDDGDLDPVFGNSPVFGNGRNTWYRNIAGVFEPKPSWVSPDSLSTEGLSLADVDGDDYPDLVTNGTASGCSLFHNDHGSINMIPSWVSGDGLEARDFALGDIDGDGDTDIAVVRNRGLPCWFSFADTTYDGTANPVGGVDFSDSGPTMAVTLGDVEGDGDLDIALGAMGGAFIVFNAAGSFADPVVWSARNSGITQDVALDDLDGDYRPDLICGTSFNISGDYLIPSYVYWNRGDPFDPIPWRTADANYLNRILTGDIDGSGWPDIIGLPGGNLYANASGAPDASPLHIGDGITAGTLADIDGDGDLDLVGGSTGSGFFVHANNRGVLSTVATNFPAPQYEVLSLDCADIDRDGDLDLALGIRNGRDVIHLGARHRFPAGGYESPSFHLTNNPPALRNVAVADSGEYAKTISFLLFDVEEDPVTILLEYKYRGDADWRRAAVDPGPVRRASSRHGTPHELTWDLSLLVPDRRDIIVRLRALESVRGGGPLQTVPSFVLDLGPTGLQRPMLALDVPEIAFPGALTLGDTATASLTISNPGNLPLVISDILLPNREMRHEVTLPLTVVPGANASVIFSLEPRSEVAVAGDVVLATNDPIRAVYGLPVHADIRALRATTEALLDGDIALLGAPLSIHVTPGDQVVIDKATLFFRTTGTAEYTPQVMLPLDRTFLAVVNGNAIFEPSLDYYVLLENSGVTAFEPPDAPATVFTQPVSSPVSMGSIVRPNSGRELMVAKDIVIELLLPQGAVFADGLLHYRPAGGATYASTPLQTSGTSAIGVIPALAVGPRGVEYWLSAATTTSVLTDPAVEPTVRPHGIVVAVPDLVAPQWLEPRQYGMVSVPLEFDSSLGITLEDLLADQPAYGPYDPTKWRCFTYDPGSGSYLEIGSDAGAFALAPERAFWLVSREADAISTSPVVGTSVPTSDSYAITLQPGWNQVGTPFLFPVDWHDCRVDGAPVDDVTGIVLEPPVSYSGGQYAYDVAVLEPWRGYWIHNLGDAPAQLVVPAVETAITTKTDAGDRSGWRLALGASSRTTSGNQCILGVSDDSKDTRDHRDRALPPAAPSGGPSPYFPHGEWTEDAGLYAADVRSGAQGAQQGGWIWRFDVLWGGSATGTDDEVTVTLSGLSALPDSLGTLLVDLSLARDCDLRQADGYRFSYGGGAPAGTQAEARFALVVGSSPFIANWREALVNVPTTTVLRQNRPNPFNASTSIRFDASRSGRAQLRIYDLNGALVKTLYDGEIEAAGTELQWTGDDDSGCRVASGVYVCCLSTSWGFYDTRKMLLVK